MTIETNPEAMAKQARQKMEETPAEKTTRSLSGFPEIEKKMPFLARNRASLVDKLTSHLGKRNPLAHPVDPKKHTVWLFDNIAWRGRGDTWNVEVVAAYFLKDSGDDESEVVANLSGILGLAETDKARETLAKRLEPFLDSVLPARTVTLSVDGQTKKLGPSSSDGISSDIVQLKGKYEPGQIITPQLAGITSETTPQTHFADETGWAIISDVDDTIKKTLTANALGILKTTFTETPEPIAGMPELYKHMKQALNNPPFWYLSASPYNLYSFLREFREAHYPPGQLILRDASWMNLAGFLASVTQGTQAYKVDRMKKVNGWFPKRKFICIGDSTQSDPEAYGEMYRKQPKWIKAIFIRKVTGVAEVAMDEEEKNKPERFKDAFKHVPDDVWHVFSDPSELYSKVDELVAKGL